MAGMARDVGVLCGAVAADSRQQQRDQAGAIEPLGGQAGALRGRALYAGYEQDYLL